MTPKLATNMIMIMTKNNKSKNIFLSIIILGPSRLNIRVRCKTRKYHTDKSIANRNLFIVKKTFLID